MAQTANWLIKKTINQLINNKINPQLQPFFKKKAYSLNHDNRVNWT